MFSPLCNVGIKQGQLLYQVQGFETFGSLALSASSPAAYAGEEELTQQHLLFLHSSEKWAAQQS